MLIVVCLVCRCSTCCGGRGQGEVQESIVIIHFGGFWYFFWSYLLQLSELLFDVIDCVLAFPSFLFSMLISIISRRCRSFGDSGILSTLGTIGGACGFCSWFSLWDVCHCLVFCLSTFFNYVLWRKISTRFLSAVVVLFFLPVIVWFFYSSFFVLMRYLAVMVASLFGAIFGLLPLWGNHLTVFANSLCFFLWCTRGDSCSVLELWQGTIFQLCRVPVSSCCWFFMYHHICTCWGDWGIFIIKGSVDYFICW